MHAGFADNTRVMNTDLHPSPGGLYRRHSGVVYSYLRCHVRLRVDAEDLTAEVFEAAIRGLSTYVPSRGSERVWLLGIAHHRLVRFHRKRARSIRQGIEPDKLPSPLADPEEQVLLSERRTEILEAIGRLASRDRQAITLRYIAELNIKEVARVLAVSRTNAAVLLHRARKRLSRQLSKNYSLLEEVNESIDPA